MEIKLETVLFVLIVGIVAATTTVKLSDSRLKQETMTKELEFYDTKFIEVDKIQMRANLFSTYGLRDNGILMLHNIIYHTHNIEQLIADKGTYKGDILFLDGNVKLKEKKGAVYTTQHANYHQKSEILKVTSPFIATMDKNIFKGNSLIYYGKTKEMKATTIDATVYTVDK